MASPGNRHCANCIGTLPFPIKPRVREEREWGNWGPFRKQRPDRMSQTDKVCCKLYYPEIYVGLL